ncbi:hypothetical protein [Sphingomonas sp. S2-65]|uniref:hypothetical protein n=1 Tax=Sphingomonas sp. S2-65 TaxID=2903960 RepID=UPI001F2856E2|nr:hypothetical protein [Sphingomonas sp. S2-65]UYY56943.1 hypothetical protein LZ586_09560 [Sphingomonas sp. S2-65]
MLLIPTPCDADLLIALEQPVIQRAVGIHFLLVDIVLDAAPAIVEIARLELIHLGRQRILALLGLTIVGKLRSRHTALLARDRAVELGNLRLQSLGRGVSRFELHHQPLIFGRKLSALLAQVVDRDVAQRLGRVSGAPRLTIARLRLYPLGRRLRQRRVERGKIVGHDRALRRRAVVARLHRQVDDLLLRGIAHQLALRLVELLLLEHQLALEQVAAIGRRLDLALQIGLDEVLCPGIRHLRGKGRVRAAEPDAHQPREADRIDRQVLEQDLAGDPPPLVAPRGDIAPADHLERRCLARIAEPLEKAQIVHQPQPVGDPLGKRARAQQAILGLVELLVERPRLALHALDAGHLADSRAISTDATAVYFGVISSVTISPSSTAATTAPRTT